MRLKLSILLAFLCLVLVTVRAEFEEYFRWKQIVYTPLHLGNESIFFPDQTSLMGPSREDILANYIAYNNVPMGATHFKGKLFVTVPRRRPGIPSTLNYVSTKSTRGTDPSFRPYPDLATNDLHPNLRADPKRIVSVYRTRADECNRLWFIDTGLLEYPNNATQVQRPSIWIMDLARNQLVSRFEIPESIVERGNGLASITVDVEARNCQDAYAYIPDLAMYRLYVYSLRQNHIWTFSHNYFNFDPMKGDFNVAGLRYQWNDGIFSITLTDKNADGFKTAYFHPMASTSEFAVSTRVLRNETASTRSNHGDDFMFVGKRGRNSQSAMHDFDKLSGVLFYSQVGISGAACWNSAKRLTPENFAVIARNEQAMMYPSDLNVDAEGTIWMMTNSMPRFIYGRLDTNEYNFRIWRQPASEAIANTVCEPGRF